MKVFADAFYWIATTDPSDPWHDAANHAKSLLGEVRLITTDEVLTEFLTTFSRGNMHIRRQAAKIARAVLANESVTVIPQTHDAFLDGLQLYEGRLDKNYSLTDCVSMNVMRAEGITRVLTNDHHFTQEGFEILIRR